MSNDSNSPLDLVNKFTSPQPPRLQPHRTSRQSSEFKIIVIGSSGVGKTSLVRKQIFGEFIEDPQLSLGTERFTTSVEVRENDVELNLYDTVGQERFMTIPTILYRNTHAILICFDVTNRTSFDAIDRWYSDIERNAPKEALILLIVTKIDLPRIISVEETKEKSLSLGIHHMETSAKTGQGVKALFALLASRLYDERRKLGGTSSTLQPPPSPSVTPVPIRHHDIKQTNNNNQQQNSSCYWSGGGNGSSSSTLDSSHTSPLPPYSPNHNEKLSLPIPTPDEGLSLAEVLVEHANLRARTLAGGLQRRNTIVGGDTNNIGQRRNTAESTTERRNTILSFASRRDSMGINGGDDGLKEETKERDDDEEEKVDLIRTCSLGCGALLESERTNHETEECWLRLVPCSLGCGLKLPMLDCVAHETEKCQFRKKLCECGKKVKVSLTQEHLDQYKHKSISIWDESDVIHFLLNLFPGDLKQSVDYHFLRVSKLDGKQLLNLGGDFSVFIKEVSNQKSVEKALRDFSFNSSTTVSSSSTSAEYSTWVEEEGPVFSKVLYNSRRSLLTPHHFFKPINGIERSISIVSDNPGIEEVDEVLTSSFAETWESFRSSTLADRLLKEDSNGGTVEEDCTREVLVPLSLGSRVVAVKTLRFVELQLNSSNLVGSGSFGSVYLGRYRGALVAVKHLHCQDIAERDLLREAAVMSSISGHPHVLRFLGVCLERPNICFVSEALQCSLEDWLRIDKQDHSEKFSEILRYAEEAASGIYHLHLEMVVHRDIAARNLLFDSGIPRRVKVCDFGLARVLPRRNEGPSSFVGFGGSLDLSGPLRWMSPESLRPIDGLTKFSFASDVYSFGITVWELLSRDVPYALLAPTEAAMAVLTDDIRPPRAKMKPIVEKNLQMLFKQTNNSEVVSRLVSLLEKCWDKNPVIRPTMRETVNELSNLCALCTN